MSENEIPHSLRDFRGQLHAAVARDLTRPHGPFVLLARLRPRRRRGLVAYAVGAAAAIALTVALVTAGSPAQSADAAVLHNVATALTLPSGTILHEMGTFSMPGQAAKSFELWAQADPPYTVGAAVGPVGGPTPGQHQAESYSSATGPAIHSDSPDRAPLDAAATLRALVQSGNASVVGTTTIDGVAAYELQVSGAPAATLDGTAYVAQSDYQPLLIQTTSGETISYSTYEYLPDTPANLAPLGIPAQSSASPSPGN
jgi:hypothetical protein